MWIIPVAFIAIAILITILILRRTSRRFLRLLLKSITENIPEIIAYDLDYWVVVRIAMSFNGRMLHPDYKRFMDPIPTYNFNVIHSTIYHEGEEYDIHVFLYYRNDACKVSIVNMTAESKISRAELDTKYYKTTHKN